jgi:hypothetical protein
MELATDQSLEGPGIQNGRGRIHPLFVWIPRAGGRGLLTCDRVTVP